MYGPDTLLLASKKPRIQELVAKSKTMTEAEIKSLSEKPDVIRGLLLINLFGDDQQKATVHEKIAELMAKNSKASAGGIAENCEIYVAMSDFWISQGSTMLEIQHGWHWALFADGRIFVTDNIIRPTAQHLAELSAISQYIKSGNIDDLKVLEYRRISKLV